MAKVTYSRAIKGLIFLILLTVFFILFFWPVTIHYSEKYTNVAKNTQKSDKIEAPTFTICTGWKKSVFLKYNVSTKILTLPPDRNTNLPSNATIRSLYEELTFKLNQGSNDTYSLYQRVVYKIQH